MSSIPVFRRTGARVPKSPSLVPIVNTVQLIEKVHDDKTYGLSPDRNASYNNPVTEETIRAKATPEVKEMKGQLIESFQTLALSPKTTSVKSPVTRLPTVSGTTDLSPTVSSPSRTILQLPGQGGTKILPLAELSVVKSTVPVVTKPAVTALARPNNLNIDPARISYGKGSGRSGAYTVKDLKNILGGLGLSRTGNKSQLVYNLVEYIRNNDPAMFSQLPEAVRNR